MLILSCVNRLIGIQPQPGLTLHIAILPWMEPGSLDFNASGIDRSNAYQILITAERLNSNNHSPICG